MEDVEKSPVDMSERLIGSLMTAAPFVSHRAGCMDVTGQECNCGFNNWAVTARGVLEESGALEEVHPEVGDIMQVIQALPDEESKKLIDLLKDDLKQVDDDLEATVNAEDAKEE